MESSKPEQTMQYLIYTHIWTYIIELDYLVQMLDKVWVNCVQFSHLCMCDKVNFSLYIIPFVKGLRLIGVDCLFYTFRQGGYIHIYDGSTSLYICRYAVCVHFFFLFILLVLCVIFFFPFVFSSLIFKWSCLCSTKDCNSFLEQGSYSVRIDLSYTLSRRMGLD